MGLPEVMPSTPALPVASVTPPVIAPPVQVDPTPLSVSVLAPVIVPLLSVSAPIVGETFSVIVPLDAITAVLVVRLGKNPACAQRVVSFQFALVPFHVNVVWLQVTPGEKNNPPAQPANKTDSRTARHRSGHARIPRFGQWGFPVMGLGPLITTAFSLIAAVWPQQTVAHGAPSFVVGGTVNENGGHGPATLNSARPAKDAQRSNLSPPDQSSTILLAGVRCPPP